MQVVSDALRYVDNNAEQLKGLLVGMLEKRDQWLHHAQHEVNADALQHTLRYLVEQALSNVAQVFNSRLQFDLMPLARFAASQLPCEHPIGLLRDWDSTLLTHAETLPMWLALRELLLTDKDEIRAGITKNIGFPADAQFKEQKAAFKAFLESLEAIPNFAQTLAKTKKLPNVALTQEAWQIIGVLSKLLNLAVAQLWFVFQQAGEVDFVEIATKATQALVGEGGVPTDLALKLDYQIQHLLVDEFQDTSPSQVALLEQLTQGWQQGDNRTLFCVGDPMQSIYRFRKANVGLFIEAANHGIGDIALEKLQLYRNNRSMPAVVNWINQTFEGAFPAVDDVTQSAIHYRAFIATKPGVESAGVEVHPIIKQPDESAESASQREAAKMIEIIQQTRAQQPNTNIAVLVRSKKHLSPLVSQLRRNHPDIKFQAVEIEALESRQIVQDLLSLTYALHHRADRVHWLAVLRAPWCGLTLHDLHALAGHDMHSTVWTLMQNDALVSQLSADGQVRLQHLREVLAEAFATQGRMNVSRWLRGVWLMLNGTACLWETSDIVDVQAFFNCLDALDRSNQFSPERMALEITQLFATPDAEGTQLQMMTIHKSKGLEFDTVILPGLGASAGGNHSDQTMLLWEEVTIEDETQLLAAPYMPKGMRQQDQVSPYDYLADLEQTRDKNEAARVLYVAVTRAERKLHLVGVANLNSKDEIKPTKHSALDLLWPMVANDYLSAENTEVMAQPADTIAAFTPQLVRLQHIALPSLFAHTSYVSDDAYAAAQSHQEMHSIEADAGTLAHQYLEMIASQDIAAWPAERVRGLLPAMRHYLQQKGHAVTAASQAAQSVLDNLLTTMNSEVGQWVLQSRESAQSELAISILEDGQLKSYVIDRTFIADGTRWIIDYKSAMLSADSSNAALKAAAEPYRKQLNGYAQLFKDEPYPICKAIFFLSVARLVIVE
jgi:ATP-dependent exoDNAse (exonuclease V) beta subunit